ncbi:MAG: S-layer homology domain-containing protein, partial [Lysinibacillus sp.]
MSLKKFALTFVIVIMSMFSIQSAYASQQFADIPTSHEAYKEINYLVNKGVIRGYTENGKQLFKPEDNVRRWQVAKMVINAAGIQVSKPSKSSFTDVKAGTEESMYVEAAVQLGIIEPTSKTTFSPHTPITRNEMAKALAVAFKIPASNYADLEVPFTDVSKSNVYYKYISAIYYNGITQGSNGKYLPNNNVKRSQFALFVARAASKDFRLELPVQGVTVPNPADAIMQVKATTDNLNVRSSAVFSGTANVLGKVNKGHVFNVYEIGTDYYKVDYNGRYAYIYKTYVEEVNATQPKPPVT